MKLFLFVLLFTTITTTIQAQGLTRYGQISNGPSNDFVDKNGRLASIPMLDANGKVLFELTTTAVSAITDNTASSGGNVFSLAPLTARGVCWSMSRHPLLTGSHSDEGSSTGVFTSALADLTGGTLYYVRAYATNAYGTGYGNEVSFTTPLSDIDGNVYATVTIGTQVWMAENLKTSKLNDGTPIPIVTTDLDWAALSTPGYCFYNNDMVNKSTYGALYNWYAVNTGKLAPIGWHVPTDADWTTLTTYLGGEIVAGVKLKETGTTHWLSPNTGATNSSGFSALPGGNRRFDNGSFQSLIGFGCWFSATEYNGASAWSRALRYNDVSVTRGFTNKSTGFSIRCVKD